MVAKDFTTPSVHLELQRLILRGQHQEEEEMERKVVDDFLSDRCVLDCLVIFRNK